MLIEEVDVGTGGMFTQMEPRASVHGEQDVPAKAAVRLQHLLSRGFETVSAALRSG